MPAKNKGFFITLEGPEGGGKSTQAGLLTRHLLRKGFAVVQTREPGGTTIAESLRKVLLDPANAIAPLAELLIYEASRAQHTEELILPALRAGKIVVCDRFTDATLAYQGYGRGLDRAAIMKLNRIATGGLLPDLTIVLDIEAHDGLAKARMLEKESRGGDRIEREDVSFHERVRKGYLAIAKGEPRRVKVIATRPEIEETHRLVVATVEKSFEKKRSLNPRK